MAASRGLFFGMPDLVLAFTLMATFTSDHSLEEGFCITILEAMACGKPVIGTPTGEIPKLITESGGGVLVPKSSPAEIAAVLSKLLSDPESRKSLGQKAREYIIANYSWETVAEKTSNLYLEVIMEKIRR